MDDELKARFQRFAERIGDDDVVDQGGLTGRDVKAIWNVIEDLVAIPYASLNDLAAMALPERGPVS